MKSSQRRKANRNFIHGAKKEIREILGKALMDGGRVLYPACPNPADFAAREEYFVSLLTWSDRSGTRLRFLKKCLSAGLIDRAGVVTQKGLEVLKND